jgi:hypothetical protein
MFGGVSDDQIEVRFSVRGRIRILDYVRTDKQ